jgi:DNA-binding transcriptional LysR family regulator
VPNAVFLASLAKQLHLTQPALSRQVEDLEEELGVALFERGSNKVRLTEAGEQFYDDSRDVLTRVEEAVERLRNDTKRDVLRVGYVPSLVAGSMPRVIERFQLATPKARLELFDLSPGEMAKRASAGLARRRRHRTTLHGTRSASRRSSAHGRHRSDAAPSAHDAAVPACARPLGDRGGHTGDAPKRACRELFAAAATGAARWSVRFNRQEARRRQKTERCSAYYHMRFNHRRRPQSSGVLRVLACPLAIFSALAGHCDRVENGGAFAAANETRSILRCKPVSRRAKNCSAIFTTLTSSETAPTAQRLWSTLWSLAAAPL